MKRPLAATAALLIGLAGVLSLAGCSEEKGAALSQDDASKLHAPLGQPMPAEAKAFMEKANKESQARAAGGAAAGAGAPAAPPANPPK